MLSQCVRQSSRCTRLAAATLPIRHFGASVAPAAPAAPSATPASGFAVREERLRRTLFNGKSFIETPKNHAFVLPGSDERKIAKASTLTADSIVLDLEDGVARNRKAEARKLVLNALNSVASASTMSAQASLAVEDLTAVLQSPKLQGIVIPKVEYASDVLFVSEFINSVAPASSRGEIRLLAAIESAVGLLNLREIAASCPRLDALIFASEDLCADMGITRTAGARELLFARSSTVVHAVAHRLQAIDMVCMEFKDNQRLSQECEEGFEMGFTGKQAIHPNQIPIVNDKFRPPASAIKKATRILEGYKAVTDKGVGAFDLDGQVIDLPVVKWAEKVLARAGIRN
ncbi:hypothetical protein CAOG_07108 [Capsaspora owczarzaki ATCC 30864]|uniref:HpcH/HpaI aldolase/citrate lyase domain-containing protein n=1 Tax=Capsaspora owczarzaki (strain ATCC 30864) TaxID=595528 RepID=A0A0D2VYN3_CAPO3|nr:hypothetical protein CAOG_07108 [Capsaspora owczarzaki ATCC 30864]KJE96847.1 hypothetical protein CAOG_007108 [Capsaspora owczarzaki ATCC 30864]|eukprot:XP_004343832.1 hypothetical protein CAOG_07108 [Capsaspora owczarzaki ATCC 30864]